MKKRTIFLLVLAAVLACVLFFCRFYFLGTSSDPVNAKTNTDFQIPDFHSQTDKDGDGIDDQTDLLQGARTYIATQPRYKSKYYETGYPDDGYGVCTDVIANAMLSAGYDLKELVAEDIAAHPEEYDIEEPNSNIDFRRVRNLKVYFAHTAIPLTTDISQIDQWQGGDIVVFSNHIGMVSDQRNDKGIPYVIHHNDPFQSLMNRIFWKNALTLWGITASVHKKSISLRKCFFYFNSFCNAFTSSRFTVSNLPL